MRAGASKSPQEGRQSFRFYEHRNDRFGPSGRASSEFQENPFCLYQVLQNPCRRQPGDAVSAARLQLELVKPRFLVSVHSRKIENRLCTRS